MSEWKETTLAELCSDISYGYTESAKQEKVGPKFLRITDIANGRLNWDSVPYCPITKENFKKYQLLPGDIVIARTGATTGANYTIKENDPKEVVYASYLIRYQIDKNLADPFFIGQLLRSQSWSDYVDAIAGGSAQPGANAKQLGSFEILLPSLSEQCSISEVLSSLDDKIDLLHRQNQTLEQLAETLFRHWFVEEANEDWEEGVLGDLVDVKYGKDHKKLSDGNIPVYGSGGFMRAVDKLLFEGESVLIPRKGTLNNVMYVNEAFWTVDTMFYTIMKRKHIAKFIYQFIKQKDLGSMNVGSAVPSMTTAVLNNMPIEIPPDDLLEKFDGVVSEFYGKIKSNQTQIRTLTALRDTLLPKLMSGEVRVSG
ncbi:restriction endonuclease subunit S [Allomuricauda sp. M10]|uniref:restriction endonuclease subunit S n=1 Tax=Allomuricauda sp. M10 TaxID=2683292 RepID=UPI001D189D69|nr:restriction endonuclease subunit S [Muricauda sp. M10]